MKVLLIPVLCLVVAAVAVQSASGDAGIGVIAGEPTGLSLKIWVSETAALDAALGWSLGEDDSFYAHADYLRHGHDWESERLEPGVAYYFGLGGRMLLREGHDSRFGVRIPLGLYYVFDDSPFDVFIELAPIMDLVPETEIVLGGGLGVRFWF